MSDLNVMSVLNITLAANVTLFARWNGEILLLRSFVCGASDPANSRCTNDVAL